MWWELSGQFEVRWERKEEQKKSTVEEQIEGRNRTKPQMWVFFLMMVLTEVSYTGGR